MLKKISSKIEKLNELSLIYSWIPNENSIRPESNEDKKKYLDNLILKYGDINKGILFDIFEEENLENAKPSKKFKENRFKYNINGNHYVMWYLKYDMRTLTEDVINFDIYCNIYQILGSTNFNFGWYKNPKMTIPDIFHVQVFWINKK
tara:strand:- start:16 stop:459 length:444 start_codon:yes stop_codon:yes gene_type:complete